MNDIRAEPVGSSSLDQYRRSSIPIIYIYQTPLSTCQSSIENRVPQTCEKSLTEAAAEVKRKLLFALTVGILGGRRRRRRPQSKFRGKHKIKRSSYYLCHNKFIQPHFRANQTFKYNTWGYRNTLSISFCIRRFYGDLGHIYIYIYFFCKLLSKSKTSSQTLIGNMEKRLDVMLYRLVFFSFYFFTLRVPPPAWRAALCDGSSYGFSPCGSKEEKSPHRSPCFINLTKRLHIYVKTKNISAVQYQYQLRVSIRPLKPLPAARADKAGKGGSSTRQSGAPKGA